MKGGELDARSRLTPLLGTAMAGVAAGCLLLFAVFARQAILDVNAGLGVLPDTPSTAIRQAITLLNPVQPAPVPAPAEEVAPPAPAVAPPAAATSPDIDVVAPPTNDFTPPTPDGRDGTGRVGLGNPPIGERFPTGVTTRQGSDEWWLDVTPSHYRGGRGHADRGRGRGHEKNAQGHPRNAKAKSSRGHDHPGRGRGTTGPPPRAEKTRPASAGHGRDGESGPKPGSKSQAHGKQHGKQHGKGNGGPSKGRGRP